MSKFIGENPQGVYAFVQYKNTDICMDFYCECNEHCHFDGYGAYTVQCPKCSTIWEMPAFVMPRKADERTSEFCRENPKMMEGDEE